MKNIILIGMSGVGKTTIGKALNDKLNLEFVDTDEFIESQTNMSIEKIFSLCGEKYFRSLESKIINDLSEKEGYVISTGGGIILNRDNIINCRKNGILILLDSSVDNIIKNLESSTTIRPLLKGENMYEKVKSLYFSREKLYVSNADYIVSVDNKSIDEIVYEILNIYAKINY